MDCVAMMEREKTETERTSLIRFYPRCHCGAFGYPGDRYCASCGMPYETSERNEQQSGATLHHPGVHYCRVCGTSVESTST